MPQQPATSFDDDLKAVRDAFEADLGAVRQPTAEAPPKQDNSALGAVGRGLASFWEQVNPVSMVSGAASAIASPLQTAKGIGQAQGALYGKAAEAFQKGDYVTGARHAVNYLLPIIGPALDAQSDKGAAGDVAGMVGGTLGLGTAMVAPEAAATAGRMVRAVPQATRNAVATTLEKGAVRRMTDVIAPKVGQNKTRFGGMAQDVAPTLASEPGMGAVSRGSLAEKVEARMHQGADELDAVADARNSKLVWHTKKIVDGLKAERRKLTAETVRQGSVKAGEDVVPAPNRARVAQIEQAISEIEQLGPIAGYEPLRRIRAAYDGPAKAVYHPSMTADFMAKMGEKLGAADVTGVLREHLAGFSPETAKVNATYSLWRKANDVMQATEEVERVRPRVGRQLIAKGAGAATGGAISGGWGAAAGYLIGPMVDSAMSSGVTTQIATARMMSSLAKSIRSGHVAQSQSLLRQIAAMTGQTARFKSALESGQLSGAALQPAMADQTPQQ